MIPGLVCNTCERNILVCSRCFSITRLQTYADVPSNNDIQSSSPTFVSQWKRPIAGKHYHHYVQSNSFLATSGLQPSW